jgi:hypothetical protein
MVQFFKRLFSRRKRKEVLLLSYNARDLKARMQDASEKLYEYRHENSWRVIKDVIDMAMNVQILEVNRATATTTSLALHQGRLQALSDLSNYVESAMDSIAYQKRHKDQAQVMGERVLTRQRQRTSNQAGAAL